MCNYCAGRDHDLIDQRAATRREYAHLTQLLSDAREALKFGIADVATDRVERALRILSETQPKAGV